MKYDPSKWSELGSIFNLCDNSTIAHPEDLETLIGTISDSIGTMSMVNYPYATNFVNVLPAWPIKAGCDAVKAQNWTLLDPVVSPAFNYTNIAKLAAMAKTFYNYDDSKECLDISSDQSSGLDDNGWGV